MSCSFARWLYSQPAGILRMLAHALFLFLFGASRAVYKSKWAIFIKWCDAHKVDFRSPSVSQIADFLLYLFKGNGSRRRACSWIGRSLSKPWKLGIKFRFCIMPTEEFSTRSVGAVLYFPSLSYHTGRILKWIICYQPFPS